MLFPYFVCIVHFTNFTYESFFLKERSWLVENHERKKVVFFRLSHNVVMCDVDRDVSAAYC